jgi:hypothetical protein
MHHKSGRTQLANIHDRKNLVAFCSICHLAFDDKEWTFLPTDMAAWLQDAKAEPERDFIREINSQRDIEFRRWRLKNDSESEASKDEHYVSAFTNEPIKAWPGEVGAVILGNPAIVGIPTTEADIIEAIRLYRKLNEIWMEYNILCSEQECPLCSRKGDDKESDGDVNQDGEYDEGSEEDDDDNEGENGGLNNQKKRRMPPQEPQSPLKISPKSHKYQTRQFSAVTPIRATTHGRSKVSMPQHITRKKNKCSNHKKSAPYSSIPYDKSVPYSHRVGYTWVNTTSNELMAIWQGLPYIKHADGQITITGPSYKRRSG